MRILSACAGVILCTNLLVTPAFAATVTIKGEVVDIACATEKGGAGQGEAHSACALTCAKSGQPLGVLTDDAIYEVSGDFTANNNARLLDFVAKAVTIIGEVTERDGKKLLNVRTISVTEK
jgi:molybdopterin-guanine dinucleotide biosynthesis protein A